MVTAPRKKRHSPASFLSLPRTLVHLIFTFTVVGEWDMTLHTLAHISRDWYALAWDMASAAKLRVVTIDWTIKENAIASRQNFLALRNKLTSRRAHIRELCIDTNGPPAAMVIIWSVAFANAPLLEVLRISNGDTWAWIGPILRAASRLCPRLRSLGLPYGCFNRPPTTPALEGALGVLLESLPRWKPFGGLQNLDLKMPLKSLNSSRSIDHPTRAMRYVKELAKNCPNLETAFGGRAGEQFVDEQWYIDLDTWEQFCASCTQLTAFDMAVVPFATSFFDVFGRHAKPKLTRLTLGSPPTWDWDEYCRRYRPPRTFGFGAAAQNPHAVLASCPGLRVLWISLSYHHEVKPCAIVNEELFGDAFCMALAKHCRRLEQFVISPSDRQAPIETFTDTAMYALATLPLLTVVDTKSVNITGNGLFALVWEGEREFRREYSFWLGGGKNDPHTLAFYDVVTQFLTRLLAWGLNTNGGQRTLLPCAQCVLVKLFNESRAGLDSSRSYITQLKTLIEAVKTQFPEMRFRVVLRGAAFASGSDLEVVNFETIAELDVYTVIATRPVNFGIDREINDVFVDRRDDESDDDAAEEDQLDNIGDGYDSDENHGYDYTEADIVYESP